MCIRDRNYHVALQCCHTGVAQKSNAWIKKAVYRRCPCKPSYVTKFSKITFVHKSIEDTMMHLLSKRQFFRLSRNIIFWLFQNLVCRRRYDLSVQYLVSTSYVRCMPTLSLQNLVYSPLLRIAYRISSNRSPRPLLAHSHYDKLMVTLCLFHKTVNPFVKR